MPNSTPADLFELALAAARAHGVTDLEAIVTVETQALTRFANNGIHQNVAELVTQLSIRPVIGTRTARVSTNRLDPAGIRSAVEEAIALTRLTEPDPELQPLAEPASVPPVERRFEATANAGPEERARAVADAIQAVASEGQTAAGIYSTGESEFALFNSRGVSASYAETIARFSITAMGPDSSGWAKESACDHRRLNPLELARSAVHKTKASRAPRQEPAGRYTVVLEPAAVLDLAGQMFGDFSGTALRDGRSFLNDRIGHKLFGSNVTIHDDVRHPQQ